MSYINTRGITKPICAAMQDQVTRQYERWRKERTYRHCPGALRSQALFSNSVHHVACVHPLFIVRDRRPSAQKAKEKIICATYKTLVANEMYYLPARDLFVSQIERCRIYLFYVLSQADRGKQRSWRKQLLSRDLDSNVSTVKTILWEEERKPLGQRAQIV